MNCITEDYSDFCNTCYLLIVYCLVVRRRSESDAVHFSELCRRLESQVSIIMDRTFELLYLT